MKGSVNKKYLYFYEGFLEAAVKYLKSEEAALKKSVFYFLDNYKWTIASGLQLPFGLHFIISETCLWMCMYTICMFPAQHVHFLPGHSFN